MVDFHCHLDLYKDPQAVVARCVRQHLYVLSVTTVPSAFEGTEALATNADRVRTALGLHPELASTRMNELPLFETLLSRTRYVGEVGLEGSKSHKKSLDIQSGVLKDILAMCAHAGGRIVSLHSRGATGNILNVLASNTNAGRFILHWYLGTPRQIARANEIGCWFSVGPAMLTSIRGRSAISVMPRDRVLPESDGPFCLLNNQTIYPWDTWSIIPCLAELWRETEENVGRRLISNFKALVTAIP